MALPVRRTEGEYACEFISRFPTRKASGPRSATRSELEPWQKFNTCSIFGWVHKNRIYRFTEAYIEVPRKNGKSIWAAGVGHKSSFQPMASSAPRFIQERPAKSRLGKYFGRPSRWPSALRTSEKPSGLR
jgi:phage terminase large subunit-like protein